MMISIDEIKRIEFQAQELYLYFNEDNENDRRYLEAFLLQTTLMEGIIVEYALNILQNKRGFAKLISKREKRYEFANAINDLFLLKAINDKEFEKLHKYKNDRNKYIHGWLKYNFLETQRNMKSIYENARPLLWSMIKKLEKASI